VLRFVFDDVAAEKKNRLVEQLFEQQKEDQKDAPGAAVPIIKRMDRLKLVMNDCHLHEWVEIVTEVVVRKLIEIMEQLANALLALRRRVDHLFRSRIDELRAGLLANTRVVFLDRVCDFDGE